MALRINNSRVSTRPWGDVDKTWLRNRLVKALEEGEEGAREAIREVYAVIRSDDITEAPSENWWGPHHEVTRDGEVILNRDGLAAAAAALAGARAEPNLTPQQKAEARRHLLRHYRELKLEPPAGLVEKVEKAWFREVPFAKIDPEQRVVYGEVYVPDERDAHGQWMSAPEIRKMAYRFMEKMRLYNVDRQHDGWPDEGVVVESFIARDGDPEFKPGAWVVAVKVLKDDTWEAIERGEITGFSIAGVATLIPGDEGGE